MTKKWKTSGAEAVTDNGQTIWLDEGKDWPPREVVNQLTLHRMLGAKPGEWVEFPDYFLRAKRSQYMECWELHGTDRDFKAGLVWDDKCPF